jgi:hypothetical protein
MIWNGEKVLIAKNYMFLSFILLWLASLISGIVPFFAAESVKSVQFLKTFAHLTFWLSTPIIFLYSGLNEKHWIKIIKVWLIMSLFINIFGAYQLVARIADLPLAWVKVSNISYAAREGVENFDEFAQSSIQIGAFYRATSIFSEPSFLATFNIMTFIFIAVPFIHRRKLFFHSKLLNFLIAFFCLAGLLLTFSMTGLLTLVFLIVSFFIFDATVRFGNLIKFVILATLIVIASDIIIKNYVDISLIELFRQRVLGIIYRGSDGYLLAEGESFEGRFDNAKQMIHIWSKSPFIGIGLGLIYYNEDTSASYSDYAFLSFLAETGLLGAIAFISIFIFMLLYTSGFVRQKIIDKEENENSSVIYPMTFYFFLNLIVINFLSGNFVFSQYFWTPMYFILSVINIHNLKIQAHSYELKLVNKPLKDTISQIFQKYFEIKTKTSTGH